MTNSKYNNIYNYAKLLYENNNIIIDCKQILLSNGPELFKYPTKIKEDDHIIKNNLNYLYTDIEKLKKGLETMSTKIERQLQAGGPAPRPTPAPYTPVPASGPGSIPDPSANPFPPGMRPATPWWN